MHSDILSAVDCGSVFVLVMLDLTAAFDTTDHSILLSRLTDRLGVTGAALEWFRSYLSGQQQLIRIGSYKSFLIPVLFGVPQGSVLGPLLFTAYIMPLGDIIRMAWTTSYMQTTCNFMFICPGGDDQLIAIERLCSCLEEIREWSHTNLLKLNDQRTDVVVFGTKHKVHS